MEPVTPEPFNVSPTKANVPEVPQTARAGPPDSLPQCARCGALAVSRVDGKSVCVKEFGGCGRLTVVHANGATPNKILLEINQLILQGQSFEKVHRERAPARDPGQLWSELVEFNPNLAWMREEGAKLLNEVHAAFGQYVSLPSAEAHDAIVLYLAASHDVDAFENAPRLILDSPLPGCGKTRALEILIELAYKPLAAANASVAAIVRSVGDVDPPLILLDEADVVFKPRRGERTEGAEDLRGIINGGHRRGFYYIRWDPKAREKESLPTFSFVVLAGKGRDWAPETIKQRGIRITMRRRLKTEKVAPFRGRRDGPPLMRLGTACTLGSAATTKPSGKPSRSCLSKTGMQTFGSRCLRSRTLPAAIGRADARRPAWF